MKKSRSQTRRIKRCLALILVLSVLIPIQTWAAADSGSELHWQDYNGKRIGVLVGPLMEDIAHTYFPDSEYLLLNSYPDCIAALLVGKIDAYLGDEPGLKSVHAEQPRIDYINDRITNQDYSFAFRKDDPESAALCEELNTFLAKSREDGTMQELDDIWFGVDEERKVVDMSDLSGENGTIRVVTTSSDMPWSYIKDGKNVGYDIDLVVRFCRYAGYRLELGDVDFAARIPAIQSGKYDFTTDMNVTPEREEQVLFSDPTSSGGVVLAILTDGSPAVKESSAEQLNGGKQPITSLDRLAQPGVTIAVGLNTPAEASLRQDYPEAKLIPYSDIFLAYLDVANGRVDACVNARREMEFALDHGLTGVRLLEETYETNKIAVGISPATAILDLKDKLNTFIAEVKADGTLDDMYDRWVTRGEETMPDIPQAENPSFTLCVGTTGTVMPYSYYVGTELAGYDIELAQRFACWLVAGLELKVYDFGGIIPAAEAGSIDCIMSNLYYTEEKEESIPFSDVLFEAEITAMVRDDGRSKSFWDGIVSSFNKTFIRENRWKLFVEGIGTTMLITVLSILFGTALGFLLFLWCRNGNPFANGITRFCLWLVQGMPMVVLLMILYYVIFGSTAISGLAVAVIGFTLTFGAAVFGMLKMGVSTVDRGQYEAAYALGHTNRHTFFKIILPQAIPHVLPAYQGEIVGLIKATAIVGYIAVQDLTKMGDIVRSRTYEAFFPLIAITVIYFVLEGLLSLLVSRIRIQMDPKKRSREHILKGGESP